MPDDLQSPAWPGLPVAAHYWAGEGAPYTGIKPAGTAVEPPVAAADKALETGSLDPLRGMITEAVAAGIRERFARAIEKRKHADDSVEAGREFVEAYVVFVHYVEGLYLAATAPPGAHAEEGHAGAEGAHEQYEAPIMGATTSWPTSWRNNEREVSSSERSRQTCGGCLGRHPRRGPGIPDPKPASAVTGEEGERLRRLPPTGHAGHRQGLGSQQALEEQGRVQCLSR
jgi:hypothetical protein